MAKIDTNIPSKIDNKVIFSLYNLFVEADEYVANKARNNCFKYTQGYQLVPSPHLFE